MTDDPKLNAEIIKLLLQVAWADDEVAREEADYILELARNADVGELELERLGSCLRGETELPPPDLSLLRHHKDAALRASRTLIAKDRTVDVDEKRVLAEIEELLGG